MNQIDPESVYPSVKNLLCSLAWKFSKAYPIPFEEAMSQAHLSFMGACRKYDPTKRTKFSTHCRSVVYWELKSLVMKRSGDPLVFVDEGLEEVPEERHATTFMELIGELPDDAREMVDLLLDLPQEGHPKALLQRVVDFMHWERGATAHDTERACEQIRGLLRHAAA